jgi:hypothetical protein
MESLQPNNSTSRGMIAGLLFVFVGLGLREMAQTAALAAIGASVSFLVTLVFKWILKKWKTRK